MTISSFLLLRKQPDREWRFDALLENKNALIRGAGGMVGANHYRESANGR